MLTLLLLWLSFLTLTVTCWAAAVVYWTRYADAVVVRMLWWCGACALHQAVRFQYGEAVVFCAAMGIILGLPRYTRATSHSRHISLAPLPDTYLATLFVYCGLLHSHDCCQCRLYLFSLHCVK